MAKQNFLSGGFYGKLGQVVGQRWKNKRTIRSYVIPHDPKTPLQMEQRNAFGKAVVYAQSAMMSNYNSNWFDNPSMSKWNVRMSTARELIKSSTTFLTRLPLIPLNVEPPFPVSQIKFTQDQITHDITFALNSEFPKGKRNISIYATNNPNTQNPDDVLLLVAENQNELWKRFTVPNVQDFTFDNNTHLRIVSNDETNSDRAGLVSNEQVGSVNFVEEYPFSLSIYKILVTSNKVEFLFNEKSLKQRNQVNADGFECFINGTKQLIDVAPLHIGYNSKYEDRLAIEYKNVWGTTEQAIQFTSNCVFKNLRWTEANEDLTLKLIAPETNVPLIAAEYETITPFDATINNVNITASRAIATFPAQTETPIEVAVDNVTVMYTENGTQKSKFVNTGITSRIVGDMIQLIIPLQNWWTTDCDENEDISMAFSSLRYKDGSGIWHGFTGTKIANSIDIQGYYYRQSDFTFSGISFSGTNATVSYSYKVANGNGLDAVTTKTCGEIKYHSSAEPVTKTNPTVSSITTTNGKLQVTLGGIDNTGEHYTLSTDTMTNLVLKGLNKTVSNNVYSDCEDLDFSQTFAEMEHLPIYLKPKAFYLCADTCVLEYWDEYITNFHFNDSYLSQETVVGNGTSWEEDYFDYVLTPAGHIIGHNNLISCYEEEPSRWVSTKNKAKISIDPATYTVGGVTYTTPEWNNVVVNVPIQGGYINGDIFALGGTKMGSTYSLNLSLPTFDVPLTWKNLPITKTGASFDYLNYSMDLVTDENCTFTAQLNGDYIKLSVSGLTQNVGSRDENFCYDVGFASDRPETNQKLELSADADYDSVPYIAFYDDWEL